MEKVYNFPVQYSNQKCWQIFTEFVTHLGPIRSVFNKMSTSQDHFFLLQQKDKRKFCIALSTEVKEVLMADS
jgi:hypothetical protein